MKTGKILLIIVLFFSLYPFEALAEKLVFGGDRDYPPYEFIDEAGNVSGFNVELAKAVARTTGLDIEIKLDEWSKIRFDFENGEIDALLGMAVTPQRMEYFDFSIPHNTLFMTVFFRKGTKGLDSESDLNDKEIIVQRGGVMHDYLLEKGITDRIILVDSPLEGLKRLSEGVGDCGIFGKYQGLYLVKKHKLKNLTVADWAIYERDYAIAVQKGNAILLNGLNKGLLILMESGEYRQIYEKWFGPLDWKTIYGERVLNVFLITLSITAFVVILLLLWNRALNKRVIQKTAELNEKLDEIKLLNKKIRSLHEIAIKMERSIDEEEVYDLIVNTAKDILSFDVCSLDILEGNELVVKRADGGFKCPERTPKNEGVAGRTLLNGETILINDVSQVPDARPVDDRIRSALSIPIGEFGVFQAISFKPSAFTRFDVELAELLISHATEAIRRIRLSKRERYLAFHDALTGLYNRTFFDEELERLDTLRNLPISVIFADVDDLKLINDLYDHFLGDEYLVAISEAIKKSCRHEDLLVRWGGDEFVILLIKTTHKQAKEIVTRIEQNLAKIDQFPTHPSVSFGIATKTHPNEKISDVLRKAERDMYRNKHRYKTRLTDKENFDKGTKNVEQ
ncbi:diguanylate cyclase domain-containing protein [Kosmotoga pacifica]|uniref:diguanylate cyclase domain-containing protein n=1 Tax=Kosmotoga pacifica TaxID=1330330 RepID=UPI0009E2E74D|nr:transporter substrate-binding domain-containing protein [Kosmotoga pacifica]